MKKSIILSAGLSLFVTAQANALVISGTSDANTLINSILGPGISVISGSANYIGANNQSGTFTDGLASGLGFDQGIVLSTGNVSQISNANSGSESLSSGVGSADGVSTDLGTAGDADLNAIVSPGFTQDAAVLEFSFQFGDGSTGGDLFFNFIFASEEYINYIGSPYNDVFGFFIDGVNIALVPGTTDIISINSINNTTNSSYYINNVDNTNGLANAALDIAFDGLTTVITASLTGLSAGPHTMKFAIADNSDGELDSAVFIQGGTFASQRIGTNTVPSPAPLALMALGLTGLIFNQRKTGKKAWQLSRSN